MWGTVLSALLVSALTAQTPLFEVRGVVLDTQRDPLPGVTVTLAGSTFSRTAVSDPGGRYRFIALPAGDYTVTASIPGFRTLKRELALRANATLDFELTHPPLIEVLSITSPPTEAYVRADAVARLRIERRLPPEPCGQIVTSTYEAAALDIVKGTLPASIVLVQETAGVCLDEGQEVKGIDRPLAPGEQYVVFLRRTRDRYLAMRGLTLHVANGTVETNGHAGLPAAMPLATFYAALEAPLVSVSGVITDTRGEPIPEVIVSIGPDKDLTDSRGRYRIGGLLPGDYRVVVGIAGFRSKFRDITLTTDTDVDFELSPGDMVAVDFVSLGPQQAYREADAIARLRIDRSLPPQPCRRTVSVTHEATVIDAIKGSLPSSILLAQRGAGVCVQENGVELEGADRPFVPREEYVMFLRRNGDRFEDLTGPLLTFKVENGMVQTRGYGDLPATLPLVEFYAAVREMARRPD